MHPDTSPKVPLARLARHYLNTVDSHRSAKSAVAVAESIRQDTSGLRHHAARAHAAHQDALGELVRVAAGLAKAEGLEAAAWARSTR